jgi:hypothetical protein
MSDAARKQVYQQSSDAPDWAALAADAWEAPSWKAAAQEFCDTRQRRGGKPPQPPDPQFLALLDPAISLEQAQRRLLEPRLGGAVASTVEALVYSLRRGADALADPDERAIVGKTIASTARWCNAIGLSGYRPSTIPSREPAASCARP